MQTGVRAINRFRDREKRHARAGKDETALFLLCSSESSSIWLVFGSADLYLTCTKSRGGTADCVVAQGGENMKRKKGALLRRASFFRTNRVMQGTASSQPTSAFAVCLPSLFPLGRLGASSQFLSVLPLQIWTPPTNLAGPRPACSVAAGHMNHGRAGCTHSVLFCSNRSDDGLLCAKSRQPWLLCRDTAWPYRRERPCADVCTGRALQGMYVCMYVCTKDKWPPNPTQQHPHSAPTGPTSASVTSMHAAAAYAHSHARSVTGILIYSSRNMLVHCGETTHSKGRRQ